MTEPIIIFSTFIGMFALLSFFNYKLNKLKEKHKILKESIDADYAKLKNIQVLVNNNKELSALDCYYQASLADGEQRLVLDIPNKKLCLVKTGIEHVLISNINLNTIVTKSQAISQELKITYVDQTFISFTNDSVEFSFSKFMTWYHSRTNDVFSFNHSKGFTTFRRDLIKHIEFIRH